MSLCPHHKRLCISKATNLSATSVLGEGFRPSLSTAVPCAASLRKDRSESGVRGLLMPLYTYHKRLCISKVTNLSATSVLGEGF